MCNTYKTNAIVLCAYDTCTTCSMVVNSEFITTTTGIRWMYRIVDCIITFD